MPAQDKGTNTSAKGNAKFEADLKKLRRIDLLELLVDQTRENEDKASRIAELEERIERLKKLVDEQAETLKGKDARIEELQRENEIYAQSFDVLDIQELAKFQRRAMIEYLSMVAKRRRKKE